MKPRRRLLVDTATTKLPIAESKIVPFTERLITPARSVIVSPIAAIRIGAAEINTPDNPTRRI
jgi:hypothetical protein